MLKRVFDPHQPHSFIRYGRMSDEMQNPRSPEQQFDTVESTYRSLGYPWRLLADYRDDGVSGQYVRKRLGLQQMLSDIRCGAVRPDLILVDTFERFGRTTEMEAIRQELRSRYGVLVLTADSRFADPTSLEGTAFGILESFRSVREGSVKAHQVLRGKRDAAKERHWPGGVTPFGFRLEAVFISRNGHQELDYSRLVPNPETAWIIVLLFDLAIETGWGQTRLAKALNANPQIPEQFKPFHPSTVGEMLKQTLYYGELTWDVHSTGIIDDHRVIEPNAPEDVLRIPKFCKAIVTREVWDEVQRLRGIRRQRHKAAVDESATDCEKLIKPLCTGISLKYLLSGLVRCGNPGCGRAMVVNGSGEYTNKAGVATRYVAYICPGYVGGLCMNNVRVPEQWLRDTVIAMLRERIFPRS